MYCYDFAKIRNITKYYLCGAKRIKDTLRNYMNSYRLIPNPIDLGANLFSILKSEILSKIK